MAAHLKDYPAQRVFPGRKERKKPSRQRDAAGEMKELTGLQGCKNHPASEITGGEFGSKVLYYGHFVCLMDPEMGGTLKQALHYL